MVLTTRDAARCIGTTRTDTPIPHLDESHRYTLPELIDIAESSSPEGRIAWTEAKRALEKTSISRAEYLPLLTLAAQGSDLRAIVPFPKPIAPRGYVTVEEPQVVAQLELRYSLLDFGRGSRLEGSKALEIASTLRLGRVHQTLAYNTAMQFYRTQQALGLLDAAKIIHQTADTLQKNAQSQFDNGRATLPDVQNAVAGEAEARYNLAAAEGEVEKAKLSLTESIGIEPTTAIEIAPETPQAAESFERSVEELIQVAWKSRPDLLARAQELRHAQEAYRTAHAAYLPKVGLQAAGGQTSMWPTADYGQLGPASVSTWQVAAQLQWDVFNGARGHEQKAALAEQKAAAEAQRATQDSVTRQVWEAYTDYQTALAQEKAAKSYLDSAQVSYDSSLDAFGYGVRSLVDVVQAERQLAQARQESVRAQARRLQTEIALSYATGQLAPPKLPATGARP
ncbi:MAG: TolC family protein [Edaphobacter sp.]|uniref:TolC family protein n=1 Tax=Edaphobacter sp. TaxID=1934404 RepID=UPI0023830F44|nr:TolC family protein [Edaphobacter sp.]MDE1174985.1 TolC family protein [Edaphobacter sp.]